MQGNRLEAEDSAPHPIGKKELLLWASEVTGTACSKFEDLRDGVVIMKLLSSIWPRAVDPRNSRKMKAAPQLEWELKRNWDTIKGIMTDIRLPVQLIDGAAIQQGRFRACYNLLVMLFFMMSLTRHREFSVDFAHPIDPRLSAFLQSNASIDALSRGGALSVQPSDTDEGDDRGPSSAFDASAQVPHDTPVDRRSISSSSPATAASSGSLLGFSSANRGSRSNSTELLELPSPSSSHPTANMLTSSSDFHNSQSHDPGAQHTDESHRKLRSIDSPSLWSAASSLSNPRVFAALEQTFIEMIGDASSLDVAWQHAAGHRTSDLVTFASCSCWLQAEFPLIRDIEATCLAFERAADGSSAFTVAQRSCNGTLPRCDFADFLIRVLYCHKACAACEPVWHAVEVHSQHRHLADISEHAFVHAAAGLGISGGAGAAREVFKELYGRESSGHSQGHISIAVICDWLVNENSRKFSFPALLRASSAAPAADHISYSAVSSEAHGAPDSGRDRIHLSNSMSVSANLVSSVSIPAIDSLALHASHSSTLITPAVRSYSGEYTTTPQSARVISFSSSLPSISARETRDSHEMVGPDSFHDSPKAAPSAHSDSRDAAQSIDPQFLRLHHAAAQNSSLIMPASGPFTTSSHSELPPARLPWKSIALQEHGEAVVAQLKVENESLHRQLQLQREEVAAQKVKYELQLEQLRQQAVLEAAVSRSRIDGLEAQLASSSAAQEARLRRELALTASNLSDQLLLVKVLGSSAIQRNYGDACLEDVVMTMKQQLLQLQGQVGQFHLMMESNSAALAAAESSIEIERKRARDLEIKVAAAIALPTTALNVAKLINAVVVEHPGGGPLSLRERRFVSIIEAMELEITEMHVASDTMIEAFHSSQRPRSSSDSKPRSALEAYEEQRELLAMSDKLILAEQREQYLAAQVSELTRILDLERIGAGSQNDQSVSRQESPHKPAAATPFAWLSQAPGPGEQERLSRNSAVVKALETAISCIPDTQSEMSSLKCQLHVALSSFWQMEVESLLLRRRLFQTSALIEASAERLHSREKLLSEELTACRQRHDETVKQLSDTHLNQCLQLGKQAALYQVQCEIKDIVAQELKLERDTAFADLQNSQAAVYSSSIGAFKTLHARLIAISQEAARLRLRDQHWVRLIQVQREAISLLEHQSSSGRDTNTNSTGDVLKLRQILEHQASILVNQINSINESSPPAASQDIVDAGLIVAEATRTISATQAATQASLALARSALDDKRQHIEKVLLDCSQFETMAVHESKRRELVEAKLNSYTEECLYLRKTLGSAMGAASRDEVLAEVIKIREAEEFASQQLLRAPPGSSLDAIIEEDSSFEPSFLLSPKGEGQPGNTGYPGDSNGSHALNGSIEDGIEF